MYEYVVRRCHDTYVKIYPSEDTAIKYAKRTSAKNVEVGLYKLVKTFTPTTKMVTHDIDEVLADLKGYGVRSIFGDVTFAIVGQLKKDGVQTLEFPANDHS